MRKPKSFYNSDQKEYHPMQKRGQFIEIGGIILIIGFVIAGTMGVYFYKDSVYIGDSTSMNLYKYTECKDFINRLDKNKVVVYNSKEKAEKDGFHIANC